MIEATLKQIAAAISISKRGTAVRAERDKWPYKEETCRGGTRRVYPTATLPTEVQAALALANGVATEMPATASEEPTYDRDALYVMHNQRPAKLREQGDRRAAIVRQVKALQPQFSLKTALNQVASANDESARTVERWIYATEGYLDVDWHVVLTPAYKGRQKSVELPAKAWDWLAAFYLTRKQPTLKESVRRLGEIAAKEGWTLPSIDTISRRIEEIPLPTRILAREGPEALAKKFPPQRRDKRVFAAGEAVTGDGLKFDMLWVIWPDGEILNTSTGWFWGDIYSGKLLAYRLAKTENTDMFRLSTYDLTAICRPKYAWVDNTVVAANKAMTGRSGNRHRFHDKANDPLGLLNQIGMDVRFTNPDKVMGSPGAKPIERSFGTGGLHELVAQSPRLKGKGFSKATAITYELFAAVVAEEVQRFNARTGRRSAVCRGILSYDQAFAESFAKAKVTKLSDSQRQILLLMPEVVRANARSGELRLKAGQGPMGKNRFWAPELMEHSGEELIVYFDPENIAGNPVSVYSMDGRFICSANHLGDVAFNDTAAAREWAKNKSRHMKANKLVAAAEVRMSELEVAAMYPAQDAPPLIPQPGIVAPNFGQKRVVVTRGHQVDVEQASAASVAMLSERREPSPGEMSPGDRFAHWGEVNARIAQGEQLPESLKQWHAHYPSTSEFETFRDMYADLGGSAAVA